MNFVKRWGVCGYGVGVFGCFWVLCDIDGNVVYDGFVRISKITLMYRRVLIRIRIRGFLDRRVSRDRVY